MAWSRCCEAAAAAAGVCKAPNRIVPPAPACFRKPPRVVRSMRSAASLIAPLGSTCSSMGAPGGSGEAHGRKVSSSAIKQPVAFERRPRLRLTDGLVDGYRRRNLARQHARPGGVACLDRNDPRGRGERGRGEVGTLAVVGGERGVL